VRNAYFEVGLGDRDADCDGVENSPDWDADGDYTGDTYDNCPFDANPGQWDADGDGAGDACDPDADGDGQDNSIDNCPLVPNANQADWDHDGKGDVCEDSDGDWIMDNQDNCRADANPDQADLEGDGIGDVCDPDDDGDTVADVADNCPLEPNEDQTETDGDIWGDACDLCPGVNSNDNLDSDGDGFGKPCDLDDDDDGVLDRADNCQYTPNANQLDFDNDGEGTACDTEERNFIHNLRYSVMYKPGRWPIDMPMPDTCTMCGMHGETGRNYWKEAHITYGAPFYVEIVGSDGEVVARSNSDFRVAMTQVLRFQPAPYAFEAGVGATVASADAAAETPASGMDYTLRITPSTKVDQLTPHELGVEFFEVVETRAYLPLVTR
jgi:Thrombospondin type 3 repeat